MVIEKVLYKGKSMASSNSLKNQNDLNKFWNEIIEAMNEVFEKTIPSTNTYMRIYNNIFEYFMFSNDEDGSNKNKISENNKKGEKLYSHLKEFLEAQVLNLNLFDGNRCSEDILKSYNSKWNFYQLRGKFLNSSFSYFSKVWIKGANRREPTQVLQICKLVLNTWTIHFVKKFSHQISDAVCQLIEHERMGKQITSIFEFSNFVESYTELDKLNLTVYNDNFANRFLEKSETFYTRESRKYIDENIMTEYMAKVYQWLQEENRRVDLYLHETTRAPLLKICRKTLIENHIEVFYEAFREFLNFDKNADLKRFYNFILHNANNNYFDLPKFSSMLEQHIKSQGLSAIAKCCESARNDPKVYVDTIMQVYRKYFALISNEFQKDKNLMSALNTAFKCLVNTNPVTQMAKTSRKSPKLVANYCHALLKKSNKIILGDELNNTLDQVTLLVHYIEDKDVFQTYYLKLLARRLLLKLSTSDDIEISMISKLKYADCCDDIFKFQKMIQDIKVSKDLSRTFRTHMKKSNERLDIDFSVKILSFGSWPFQKSSSLTILPLQCKKIVNRFESFYSRLHSGKKLHWLNGVSFGELTMFGCQNNYVIKASTFQMSILLLYNQSETWSIGQLKEKTSIELREVVQIIQDLLKKNLVTCTEKGENLSTDSVIAINKKFTNKKLRFNINFYLKKEAKIKQEQTDQQIQMDRIFTAQAAIIRIMKSRKTLKHQLLIGEALKQMETKFKTPVSLIKKCINILIDKEYIERCAENPEIYKYIA